MNCEQTLSITPNLKIKETLKKRPSEKIQTAFSMLIK